MRFLHRFRLLAFQFCVIFIISICAVRQTLAENKLQRPHIVFLLTDDMGCGDVSCYSSGIGVPTPNIDRLAREGIRFTQFYVMAPICSPSRTGLLTGRFPAELRITSFLQTRQGNRECNQNDYLDPDAPTLPDMLKSSGYKTAHIGKWHLGGGRDVDNAPSIGKYGYDEWISTWESPEPHPDLGVKYAPWDTQMEPGQAQRHDRTRYMVDKTLDFLRLNKEQPCYVSLWPDDTHTPHRPSPEMLKKYGGSKDDRKTPLKNFKGVLEEYDKQIGRLLDGIRELGIEENTIVIFTADNGPAPHLEHQRTAGLRGAKLSLYEGGIREPFLVRWPRIIPKGKVNETTVLSGVDLFPTLCKLANVEIPLEVSKSLAGEDLSGAFFGETPQRKKKIFWEYGGRRADGGGRPRDAFDRSPTVAIRDGKWKLLVEADGTNRQLYDIPADPHETQNLYLKETKIADELTSQVLTWRRSLPDRNHGAAAPRPNEK
ncbi:sulfatase-like hydrolase/transferase [Candidatus Sumerlaeota bacterium]|nr:sulfatase-like hydrolase/transferase [Candidatus Sumerlaeota bacterium]